MDIDDILDARSLNCPMPILQTKKKLAAMHSGQILQVLTTDPDSVSDFNVFSQQTGHELLSQEKNDAGEFEFILRKRIRQA